MARDLEDIYELLLRKGLPFCYYSLPQDENVKLVVQEDAQIEFDYHQLNSNSPGFVYRPFEISRKPKIIKADYSGDIKNFNWNRFEQISDRKSDSIHAVNSTKDLAQTDYLKRVNAIIESIKSGGLKKVVFSRTKTITHNKPAVKIFQALHEKYLSAFTYILRTHDGQIWLGASPEILVAKTNDRYKTIALAGTVLNEDRDGLFSDKNIEEQELVKDFILRKLENASAKNIECKEPKAQVAVNVAHIKTEIFFDLNETEAENVIRIAEELHPTPAIAGIPLKKALDVIDELENYDRELYAGYLGPVNLQGETALFVNIRNAKYFDGNLKMFVGGGIIEGSDSQMEWQETENKSYTMEQAIV